MKEAKEVLDLLGIGLGPFNLSLAALLAGKQESKSDKNSLFMKFCDLKENFSWHPELMFSDANMQTCYLKDLVTPVDPTNRYSFLNYLVKNNQFYQFINTDRRTINRIEFEQYCKWVSKQLTKYIDFNSRIESVEYNGESFVVKSQSKTYETKHLCVAAGPIHNIPDCVKPHLCSNVFHAKSKYLKSVDFSGKRVLVVGGGQTGLEIFRNGLKEVWSKPKSITLVTGRANFVPLDEGPFTNEVFTPDFVEGFYNLKQDVKDQYTNDLVYASDGNTPSYLQDFYNELYLDQHYFKKFCPHQIIPMTWLTDLRKDADSYEVVLKNNLEEKLEVKNFDIIVLATGFKTQLPKFLDGLKDLFEVDSKGRPVLGLNYQLKTATNNNKIFMMNYGRHSHGIADPQTSLMAWRSSKIANELLASAKLDLFKANDSVQSTSCSWNGLLDKTKYSGNSKDSLMNFF